MAVGGWRVLADFIGGYRFMFLYTVLRGSGNMGL